MAKTDLLMKFLSSEEPRQERARALAALVMWFAAGALVYSAATPFFAHLPSGSGWDAAAGTITVVVAESCEILFG